METSPANAAMPEKVEVSTPIAIAKGAPSLRSFSVPTAGGPDGTRPMP